MSIKFWESWSGISKDGKDIDVPVKIFVDRQGAIALQRRAYGEQAAESSDEDLLADFCSVHWASDAGTEVSRSQLDFLCICSFRYSLGRVSSALSDCVALLLEHWASLSPGTQRIILRELREALERDWVAEGCDREEWLKLLKCSGSEG